MCLDYLCCCFATVVVNSFPFSFSLIFFSAPSVWCAFRSFTRLISLRVFNASAFLFYYFNAMNFIYFKLQWNRCGKNFDHFGLDRLLFQQLNIKKEKNRKKKWINGRKTYKRQTLQYKPQSDNFQANELKFIQKLLLLFHLEFSEWLIEERIKTKEEKPKKWALNVIIIALRSNHFSLENSERKKWFDIGLF